MYSCIFEFINFLGSINDLSFLIEIGFVDEEINRLSVFMDMKDYINKQLSIDSYKPEVIKYALDRGFHVINDISGGGEGNANIKLAAKYDVPIIIMHTCFKNLKVIGIPNNLS